MDWEIYKTFLLQNIPSAKPASNGTEINCRCFECMDSKNKTSAHMYISIPYDNDKPSYYYCHKCNSMGIVDHNTLIKWGIFDVNIALEMTNYLNGLRLSGKGKKYFAPSVYQIRYDYVTPNDKSEEKRQEWKSSPFEG